MPTSSATDTRVLEAFDGLRSGFKHFKNELEDAITTLDRASYIPKCVQLCADVLHEQFTLASSNGTLFSSNFNDHDDEMDVAMLAGSISNRLNAGSTKWMAEHMGSDWNNAKKLGLAVSEHKRQLEEERCEWILHLHRTIHKRLVKAIWGGDINGPGTTYTDSLCPILLSKQMLDLVHDGKGDRSHWLERPWTQPIIQALALMYFKYQGVQDPQSLNFASEMDQVHLIANGFTTKTIWQLDQQATEIFEPQLKLWKTVEDFFANYRCNLLTNMVTAMALRDSDDKEEWRMCKEALADLRSNTSHIVEIDDIYKCIRTAENEIITRKQRTSLREQHAKDAAAHHAQAAPATALKAPATADNMSALKDQLMTEVRAMFAEHKKPSNNTRSSIKKREGNNGKKGKGGKQPDGTVVYTYPLCSTCNKHHKGGSEKCIHNKDRDIDKEIKDQEASLKQLHFQARLKSNKKEETSEGGPTAAERKLAAAAKVVTEEFNKDQSTYPASRSACMRYHPATHTAQSVHVHSYGAALNVRLGPCIDSATQVGVTYDPRYVVSYDNKRYSLTGINGTATPAQGTTNGFPTVTDKGVSILLTTPDSIIAKGANENLIGLAQLYKSGHRVAFATGRAGDPEFGGYLHTADGHRVPLLFKDNLWRLPIFAPASHPTRPRPASSHSSALSSNPYASLLDLHDVEEQRESEDVHTYHLRTRTASELLTIDQQMQIHCARWGHCGRTKHMQNYRHYKGKGFPSGFPTLLNNWTCPTCMTMKSARQYRVKPKLSCRQHPATEGSDTESDSDDEDSTAPPPAQPPPAHPASQPTARDQFHIDYGYSIAVGVRKEKYFLAVKLQDVDFLWDLPTATRASPELLLQDFVNITGVSPTTIRCDNEFYNNEGVEQWARHNKATLLPGAAYNHTMVGKVENAVRISKDHLRCLLKHANAPYRFWPYALKHFCRTYNWWARKDKPPPWTRMPQSCRLYHDQGRDLQVWGCLVTGRIPTEHPLVQIDKTNADRSLQA